MAKDKSRIQRLKDAARLKRFDWGVKFPRCWICGEGGWLPRIQTHEMAPCSQSSFAWILANYFRVCGRCHNTEIPGMTIEHQLALKKYHDPDNYDVEAVRELLTKKYILKRAEDADDEDKRQGLVSIEEHFKRIFNQKGRRA